MERTERIRDAHGKGGLLYPVLVIAGIAVTVFSAVGIATMLGWMPDALSGNKQQVTASATEAHVAVAPQQSEHTAPAVPSAYAPERVAAAPAANAPAAPECTDCGTIQSIRPVEVKGQGTWMGAGGGAAVGALLGSQIGHGTGKTVAGAVGAGAGAYGGLLAEKELRKTTKYQVRIRMDEGKERTFYRSKAPAFAAGQRVRVTDKGIFALDGATENTAASAAAGAPPTAPVANQRPSLVKAGS